MVKPFRKAVVSREADGDTEQRILDAAHAVFMRAGTAGARMQEIAREAGVNSALLHYYFRSKARLAEAVFERAAGQLLPAVVGVLASDLPIPQKVARVVDVELAQLTRTPYLPAYIISELAHHRDRIGQLIQTMTGSGPQELGRGVLATLDAQIRAEVRAGRMRPIPAAQFVVNLLSLCVFPFAARPLLQAVLGLDEAGFARFIARRRTDLPAFFLAAIRP